MAGRQPACSFGNPGLAVRMSRRRAGASAVVEDGHHWATPAGADRTCSVSPFLHQYRIRRYRLRKAAAWHVACWDWVRWSTLMRWRWWTPRNLTAGYPVHCQRPRHRIHVGAALKISAPWIRSRSPAKGRNPGLVSNMNQCRRGRSSRIHRHASAGDPCIALIRSRGQPGLSALRADATRPRRRVLPAQGQAAAARSFAVQLAHQFAQAADHAGG